MAERSKAWQWRLDGQRRALGARLLGRIGQPRSSWHPYAGALTDGILRGNRESVHPIGSLAAYGVAKLVDTFLFQLESVQIS
jgi:hypothetical protein